MKTTVTGVDLDRALTLIWNDVRSTWLNKAYMLQGLCYLHTSEIGWEDIYVLMCIALDHSTNGVK